MAYRGHSRIEHWQRVHALSMHIMHAKLAAEYQVHRRVSRSKVSAAMSKLISSQVSKP